MFFPFIQLLLLVKLIQHCCLYFTGDSNLPYDNDGYYGENMNNYPTVGHSSAPVYDRFGDGHGDPFKTIFTNPFIQFLLLVKSIQNCCFYFTGDSNRAYANEEDHGENMNLIQSCCVHFTGDSNRPNDNEEDYSENMNNDPTVRHSSASVNDSIGHGHRDPFKTIFTNLFIQFLLLVKLIQQCSFYFTGVE